MLKIGGDMKEESDSQTTLDRPALLVLIRHAESFRNAVKGNNIYMPVDDSAAPIKGIPDYDIPLTPRGQLQAQVTGPFIRKEFGLFDVVYDSDYRRTVQTREGIFTAYTAEERSCMKFRSNDYVRERRSGYTYEMLQAEVEKYFPWWKAEYERDGPFDAVPPGGESQSDVCRAVYTFIGILMRIRAGQKVCVVTHGGTIRAFRYNLERWTRRRYIDQYHVNPPQNCGVTVYRFSNESKRLELEEYNRVFWTEELLSSVTSKSA